MKNSKNLKNFPKFLVATLNTRTLSDEAYLAEFELALKKIKYDVVGLCEVKRQGENTVGRNGFTFYHFGTSKKLAGVGFAINKRWQGNKKVIKSFSSRVAALILYVNEKESIGIVQVYAPTSTAKDSDMNIFYRDVEKAEEFIKKSTWKIVMGDFNAKIGHRSPHESDVMGPFGFGTRNQRGERLIRHCRENEMFIANSIFKRKPQQKWTWLSADQVTKNEIDFILTPNKDCVLNVQVLNRFDFATDHRMVRMIFKLKTNVKRFHQNYKKKIVVNPHDAKTIMEFNQTLKTSLKNASDENSFNYLNFQESILKAGNVFRTGENRHPVLTAVSKEMISKREKLRSLAQSDPAMKNEYIKVRRETKKCIRSDERNYNLLIIDEAIRNNRGLKVAREGIVKNRNYIQSLKDENNVEQNDRDEVMKIATKFYQNLYKSELNEQEQKEVEPNLGKFEEISDISLEEVKSAMSMMKNRKACGDDEIPVDLLKVCDESVLKKLTQVFNELLGNEELPNSWHESRIILLFKKGKKNEIENYRPISLISHVYKIFCKIILNRVDEVLDQNQPPDQAGFRKSYSTADHLLVINQLIEKYQEFNKELHIAFIDYTKAFDTVEICYLLKALQDQEIPDKYIRLMKHIYEKSQASIYLEKPGEKFKLQRGVKQGDPMSPKLFNVVLESIFRTLKWNNHGLNIDGKMLSNLRYADDIALFSESKEELLTMIKELKDASKPMGLIINETKTKIIRNTGDTQYIVDGEEIEVVEDFKYLGQIMSFNNRQSKNIDARVSAAWRSFWAMKSFLLSDLPIFHKKRLMDGVILPILTYGAQSWSLSSENERKIQVEQRGMERRILKVSRIQHITNEEIRRKTKIKDALVHAKELKWNYAGHVQRLTDDRWTNKIENWIPRDGRRNRGHQLKRWRDEIEEIGMGRWREKANDRMQWKQLRESFVLKWTDNG